jgi:transposase InsO family protein
MSNMPKVFEQPDDRGLWRFGIISPLLHRTEDGPPLRVQILELSQRVFYTPEGREKRFCPDTIRDWLCRYRTCGIDGLRNKLRKDQGSTLVPLAFQQALVDLRKSKPQWTVKRLLKNIRNQGLWDGRKPSKSALYRFTAAHSLNRTVLLPPQPVRSFQFPYFGDLWSADFLHGPKIRLGTFACKTYLHAIIDDATRYVVAARFHLAEDTRSLLDDLMLGIRRFGIPKRFYTDNGAAFRSHHLRLVAAKLGVTLPHTPPYKPRGRGKIERFFRSVRDGFLTGRDRTSLDKINTDFAAWLNQYHQTLHRILGMSPLERKLSDTGPELKQIAPTRNINDIFRMEQLKRVGSDGCVRLFKKRFEIPDSFPGSLVTVYYLPWNQDYILAGPDKLFVKPLDAVNNAVRFDKPHRGNSHPEHKENDQ